MSTKQEYPPSSSSRPSSTRRLLAVIRAAKSRFQNERPRTPVHPPPPSSSHQLPAPEDITSRLASKLGLNFKAARRISQAYVDKAVELQFLSQNRMSATQRRIVRTARRTESVNSFDVLQSKLRESQEQFYKHDIQSLLQQTMEMTEANHPHTGAPKQEETDEETEEEDQDTNHPSPDVPSETLQGSYDEDDEDSGDDGPADAEDVKALQNMEPRSICILAGMYHKGHTLPRRFEKIKLAEATGLTYRQIGIWYSNRRERNRPNREDDDEYSDSGSPFGFEDSPRGSTVEISTSERGTSEPSSSPMVHAKHSFKEIDLSSPKTPQEYDDDDDVDGVEVIEDEDEDMADTEVEDELDSPLGQYASRVTSLSSTLVDLEPLFAAENSPGSTKSSDSWAPASQSPSFVPPFVNVVFRSSATIPSFEDFHSISTEHSYPTAPASVGFGDLDFLGRQPPMEYPIREFRSGPSTQLPTYNTYSPSSPQTEEEIDDRPVKRPRVGGPHPLRRGLGSPMRYAPNQSTRPSKPRLGGVQQRRGAIAGSSSSPQSTGTTPVAIAPRPSTSSGSTLPQLQPANRGVKRSASSQDLSEPSSSSVAPLFTMPEIRHHKPMPRRSQSSRHGGALPLRPTMSMT
ncbi:hypothetical protein FRB90_011860 [Tulasnella sp. 427]|nr:hypothetical protein FRB90_011860 [Tulasnella sp. 427]